MSAFFSVASARGSEIPATPVDVFVARSGGYATYRIPGLVTTPEGTLLAYCEARKTGTGDWSEIDILLRRSSDGGRTWEPAQKIVQAPADVAPNPAARGRKADAKGATLNNPTAIVDAARGTVYFLYCVNYARCFVMRSDDDGKSFSAPAEITAAFEKFRPEYAWQVLATGPGHGIQLRNGRLLVPVWLSPGTGAGGHRPSCVSTIYSDDAGKTWERGQIVVNHSPATPNPSETAVVELSDGRVMLDIRNESARYRRLVSITSDGATEWCTPTFDDVLIDPICQGSLLRLTGKDGGILFANPANPDVMTGSAKTGAAPGKPRKNLTIRLSRDDGKTWPISRVLDAGMAGYCDLAPAPDGSFYCLYECGGLNGNAFDTKALTLVHLDRNWLEGQPH